MKLWKLMFRHYSPKDSEEGSLCYLLADTSKQIYEYMRDNTSIDDGSEDGIRICTIWKYKEDPNEPDYDPTYKERLIACCGEMFDEKEKVDDRYYGVTHYGWRCVCENVSEEQIELIKKLGILVVDIAKDKIGNSIFYETKEIALTIPCKDIYEKIGEKIFYVFDGEIVECTNGGVYLDVDGELYFTLVSDEKIFPYREPDPEHDSDPSDWSMEFMSVSIKEWNKNIFSTYEKAERCLENMKKIDFSCKRT